VKDPKPPRNKYTLQQQQQDVHATLNSNHIHDFHKVYVCTIYPYLSSVSFKCLQQ